MSSGFGETPVAPLHSVTMESRVGADIESPDLWEDLSVIEISCRPNLNSADRGTQPGADVHRYSKRVSLKSLR